MQDKDAENQNDTKQNKKRKILKQKNLIKMRGKHHDSGKDTAGEAHTSKHNEETFNKSIHQSMDKGIGELEKICKLLIETQH